jgi:hypothetical protein
MKLFTRDTSDVSVICKKYRHDEWNWFYLINALKKLSN